MNPGKARGLSPELQTALEPLLAEIESLSERIREYNPTDLAPGPGELSGGGTAETGEGSGTPIALTYLPTLEDAHHFRKSSDVGCYLGLQPGRRNSGQSEPQLHISKEIPIYERCWCRARTPSWGRLERTAICGAGL